MDIGSPLVFRHTQRIFALLAWAACAWCALVLLASVALAIAGHAQLPGPDPRLAPFRWEVLDSRLA
jgi:hypothetical protein